MNEFQELLGKREEPLKVTFTAPKEMLCRGLRYFVGDNAKWVQGYDEIAEWMQDNKGKGLMLYGSNGRGKSMMAYRIIPTLFQYYYNNVKTYRCRAINLRNLESNQSDYYSMKLAKVIFIDDFGSESITSVYGEKRDVFSDIVDEAEHGNRLLVLSTNLTQDEIKARYGIRTLDRLHAITRAICLTGNSLRG